MRGRLTQAAVSAAALAGLILAGSPPASADPPQHSEGAFSESVTLAAGELCDVAVRQDVDYTDRSTTFGDPADPDRVIVRAKVRFTYTNLGTGETVTDDGRFVFTIDSASGQLTVRGVGGQMRDGNGRLIEISAGRTVFDWETFEVISATPNSDTPDYDTLVCTNLGAQPAG